MTTLSIDRDTFKKSLQAVLETPLAFPEQENFTFVSGVSEAENQNSTNDAFSRKWTDYKDSKEKENLIAMQKQWYLECYGFDNEAAFKSFLADKNVIYDAGCGIGFKAAWFAELAPHAVVIGVDFSEAAKHAAAFYKDIPNLFFIQSDIATSIFKASSVDYVSCDQVIMHTEDPEKTFEQLTKAVKKNGQFACYFYAKKALPRELIDDYFRTHCKNMSHDEIIVLSDQLTALGKVLSELDVSFDTPDIPALGIKGGEIDIQRFIYWNFLKCFWNEEMGPKTSTMINFDWYSPTNAKRYSEKDVKDLITANDLDVVTFHQEEACYSGRFRKSKR